MSAPQEGRTRDPWRRGATLLLGVACGACLLGACSGADPTGTPAQQLQAWESSTSFGNGIGALDADAGNIEHLVSVRGSAKELQTVCLILGDDARSANQGLGSPDGQLNDELAAGYADDGDAARLCYEGAGKDQALLVQSVTDLRKAAVTFAAALSRIEVVTGKVPSTTTTSQPASSAQGDPFA